MGHSRLNPVANRRVAILHKLPLRTALWAGEVESPSAPFVVVVRSAGCSTAVDLRYEETVTRNARHPQGAGPRGERVVAAEEC